MSTSQIKGGSTLALEKFMGKTEGEYPMWKDKFLTYIGTLDTAYEQTLLAKDVGPATVKMVDFLEAHPERPVVSITEEMTKGEAKEMRYRLQHWERAHGGLLNLFNLSLTNSFLQGLPDKVSNMRPCDIWKALEVKYGGGDAGGVLTLRRQWDRALASNWDNLGDLFTRLKKARNEMNRKMSTLVGKDMVTEHWLCMEVLAQLPSMFWGSSIIMTEEWFTVENVEVSLRRVFGGKSRKEIMELTNKRRSVVINVAKKFVGKKRTQNPAEAPSSDCYYCFEDGHRKKECPVMAKDRDPDRAGGPLFRSNIRTAPSTKKKRVMAVEKGKAAKKPEAAEDEEMTPAEAHEYDDKLQKAIAETNEYEFKDQVPVSDGDEEQKPFTQMDIDNEEQEPL